MGPRADKCDCCNCDAISAKVVAAQILWLRKLRRLQTTPMHVIKLVYLCHGWMLGLHGRPLIRERVEAWQYGPVVSINYYTYKRFGGGPIDVGAVKDRSGEMEPCQKRIIEDVVGAYRHYGPLELSSITHMDGTPWSQTRDNPALHGDIPNELIESYYRARAHKEE